MTKIAGSGSISQRHPHQNVTDPNTALNNIYSNPRRWVTMNYPMYHLTLDSRPAVAVLILRSWEVIEALVTNGEE
jgi:hypothetical protein